MLQKATREQAAADTSIIEKEIAALGPWFHNLHLPGGVQTAPDHFLGDFPAFKWQEIEYVLPQDMSGWEVLDIGCNAGFYSLELARRGARVTAIDIDQHYLKQARWAARTLEIDDRIHFRKATVYDLAHERKQYDLVWFMGVLYHLRHPLLALDIARHCCRGRMMFQTMTAPGEDVFETAENYRLDQRDVMNEPGWPKMAFVEHRIADDPTNWWAPNHAGVMAMLRAAGFANAIRVDHETYWCYVTSPPPAFGADELDAVFRGSQP